MAQEEGSGVERLKKRLYARGLKAKPLGERAPLSRSDIEAPTNWADIRPPAPEPAESNPFQPQPSQAEPAAAPPPAPVMRKKSMSFATKFLLGSVVFFIGAIGVSAALFFGGVNTTSPQNIDVQVITPSLVDGGKEATIEILITNRNTTPLQLADLVIDYPDGARSVDDPTQALTHQRISIGTINSGQQLKRTISALFYGSEGTAETLVARLECSVSGSNSVFEKQNEATFTIGSSPVSLTVDAPSRATSGDPFGLDVTVRSNASTPVENVAVEAQYPFGFTVSGANPQGTGNNTLWRLGTLQPGASKTIHITGSINASDGDERVFRFLVGSNSDQTDPHVRVPFLTVPQTLTVEKPYISGTLSVDGQTGSTIAVAAGKTLQGTISWANNLSDSVSDLELSLQLDGPALDKNSISAQNGFYQSNNSTIEWTSSGDSSLASVPPGGSGNILFSFATLPPGANGSLITNPTITLTLQVKANRQGDTGGEAVSSVATTKVVLASQLSLTAQSFRNSSTLPNTGPVPPRAESESSYVITWTVKNSANTVANGVAETILPPYARFVVAESGSGITYDESSRTVRWNLGDIKPGVGYTAPVRQASFQVAVTPSTSQVGGVIALIGDSSLSGLDRFTQVSLTASASAPTTATSDGVSGVVGPKQ
jgi:hypothetical protein